MLNLHELNVFVEAALAQNFSVAARRLFLSQPAVSLHIGNLEKHLGMELFHRNGRSIQLSEAGRVLLPLAQESLRQARRIEETMCGLKGHLIGQLSIACSTTVGKFILPQLVAGFRRRHPQVRVTINVMSRRGALDLLLASRSEIAIVSTVTTHNDLVYEPFIEDPVVLIVPSDHPWAAGGRVCPSDLIDQPFILREQTSGTQEMVSECLVQHGVEIERLDAVLTLANDEAIELSVEAGIGIAFVSRLTAARGLSLGKIVEVPVNGMALSRQIYMVRHQRHGASPLQQAFWDFAYEPENTHIRHIPECA